MFHFLRFDKEAFFVSFTIMPLTWSLSLVYDELQFCWVINIGPFQLAVGNPFFKEYAEDAGEGKIIFFESRRDLIKRGMNPNEDTEE